MSQFVNVKTVKGEDHLNRLASRAGGLTPDEQELVRIFTPEIIALYERGLDSVLVLHVLRDLDQNDPSSHDLDTLEVAVKKNIHVVSTFKFTSLY